MFLSETRFVFRHFQLIRDFAVSSLSWKSQVLVQYTRLKVIHFLKKLTFIIKTTIETTRPLFLYERNWSPVKAVKKIIAYYAGIILSILSLGGANLYGGNKEMQVAKPPEDFWFILLKNYWKSFLVIYWLI